MSHRDIGFRADSMDSAAAHGQCAPRPPQPTSQMTDHMTRLRTWTKGSDQDLREGLLGWISVEYGSLVIDNITLRRTSSGRIVLSFPSRTARNGQKHAIVRPVDDRARQAIEAEILGQLGQAPKTTGAKEAIDG
jgi:DNA-binding cell septation regulator SpoVG